MKKRIMAIVLSAILSIPFLFACTGCKENPQDSSSGLTFSETVLCSGQNTEYTLLISDENSDYTALIQDEFTTLFKQTTGSDISVSTEDVAFSKEAKIISVGDTKFARQSGITANAENLLESGYRMKTYGNAVVIWGNTDYGALCGMYDFFESLFDLEIYAVDEMSFTKKETLNTPVFDSEVIPSIDLRAAPSWMVASDNKYTARLKFKIWSSVFMSIENQNMATTFALMPKDKYYEEHSDWYNTDASDMCYSNEEMQAQMIENLKGYIIKNPEFDKVMIGQEDNCSWCNCERCKNIISQYNNANVSTAVLCINRIEKEINEWLKSIGDDRTMHFGIFAYQKSINAPAVKENGEWRALLKCNPNVFVMYAPIEANYFYSFDDAENEEFSDIIEAWKACSDTIYVWSYAANFNWYLIDFPNWENLQSTFQAFKRWGVKLNFSQSPYDMAGMPNAATFANLRAYLISKLSFDCDADYQTLIDGFFKNYYKDASEYIYRYFTELRDLEVYNVEVNGMSGFCGSNLKNEAYWPNGTLLRWQGYIDKAYESIEYLKVTDEELYETLYWRINKESIMIRYLLLDMHSYLYDSVELQNLRIQFMNDMNTLEIYNYKENTSASELYSSWGIL